MLALPEEERAMCLGFINIDFQGNSHVEKRFVGSSSSPTSCFLDLPFLQQLSYLILTAFSFSFIPVYFPEKHLSRQIQIDIFKGKPTISSKESKLQVLQTEEYNKICNESIPLAERNLTELKEELEQKTQALDDVLGVLAQISSDKELVESLIQPVDTCDRLFSEIQKLHQEVVELEDKLDLHGVGVKSKEELQREIHTAETTKWREEREKKVKVDNAFKNLEKLEADLDQLTEESNQVDLEMKDLQEAVKPLSKEVEKYRSAHENMKNKLYEEYEEQAELKRKFHQDVDMLDKLITKIDRQVSYEKENIPEKLKEVKEKQAAEISMLQSYKDKKKELSAEVDKASVHVTKQSDLKRNIEDNIKYTELKAKVDEYALEIESLEENILSMGGIPASEAHFGKLSKERERLLSELNKYHGTVAVYQKAISKNKIDLKNPEYKDIDKRYFDQLLKLKTTEMANKDLNKYYNALNK
ncbi:hypothetical protein L1887_27931 [Cichorium endivia]|nr:hypothetical protein L1887_27931 [Cichorium endivia]